MNVPSIPRNTACHSCVTMTTINTIFFYNNGTHSSGRLTPLGTKMWPVVTETGSGQLTHSIAVRFSHILLVRISEDTYQKYSRLFQGLPDGLSRQHECRETTSLLAYQSQKTPTILFQLWCDELIRMFYINTHITQVSWARSDQVCPQPILWCLSGWGLGVLFAWQ